MDCHNCQGMCCKNVSFLYEEKEAIIKKLPELKNIFEKAWESGVVLVFPGVCPFLSENKCSIYALRPSKCKAYPIIQYPRGQNLIAIGVQTSCPNYLKISRTDIKQGFIWINYGTRLVNARATPENTLITMQLHEKLPRYPELDGTIISIENYKADLKRRPSEK
jgi:Fe-S-cluster containining protein